MEHEEGGEGPCESRVQWCHPRQRGFDVWGRGPCECRSTGIFGRLGSRGTPSRIKLSLRPPWLSRARLAGPSGPLWMPISFLHV